MRVVDIIFLPYLPRGWCITRLLQILGLDKPMPLHHDLVPFSGQSLLHYQDLEFGPMDVHMQAVREYGLLGSTTCPTVWTLCAAIFGCMWSPCCVR